MQKLYNLVKVSALLLLLLIQNSLQAQNCCLDCQADVKVVTDKQVLLDKIEIKEGTTTKLNTNLYVSYRSGNAQKFWANLAIATAGVAVSTQLRSNSSVEGNNVSGISPLIPLGISVATLPSIWKNRPRGVPQAGLWLQHRDTRGKLTNTWEQPISSEAKNSGELLSVNIDKPLSAGTVEVYLQNGSKNPVYYWGYGTSKSIVENKLLPPKTPPVANNVGCPSGYLPNGNGMCCNPFNGECIPEGNGDNDGGGNNGGGNPPNNPTTPFVGCPDGFLPNGQGLCCEPGTNQCVQEATQQNGRTWKKEVRVQIGPVTNSTQQTEQFCKTIVSCSDWYSCAFSPAYPENGVDCQYSHTNCKSAIECGAGNGDSGNPPTGGTGSGTTGGSGPSPCRGCPTNDIIVKFKDNSVTNDCIKQFINQLKNNTKVSSRIVSMFRNLYTAGDSKNIEFQEDCNLPTDGKTIGRGEDGNNTGNMLIKLNSCRMAGTNQYIASIILHELTHALMIEYSNSPLFSGNGPAQHQQMFDNWVVDLKGALLDFFPLMSGSDALALALGGMDTAFLTGNQTLENAILQFNIEMHSKYGISAQQRDSIINDYKNIPGSNMKGNDCGL